MTKAHSLLNTATLAHNWETAIIESRDPKSTDDTGFWTRLENIAERSQSLALYSRGDISTWADSAGASITARIGDYHCVSYWDGEDIIFIYECSVWTDLSEAIHGNPICQIAL
tara:strand:- start:296 stop:634 length:339 start_codon:yes stop_codon:yes gene_type:complete